MLKLKHKEINYYSSLGNMELVGYASIRLNLLYSFFLIFILIYITFNLYNNTKLFTGLLYFIVKITPDCTTGQ